MQPPPHDPYAPPQAPPEYPPAPSYGYAPSGMQVAGQKVWVPANASLRPLCVKCGCADGIAWAERRVSATPGWAYLLLIFGGWPGLIAIMVSTRSAAVPMATCAPCAGRWLLGRVLFVASIVVPILGGLALVLIGAARWEETLQAVGGLTIGSVIFTVPFAFWFRYAVTVTASEIDAYSVTLTGVSRTVLQAIAGGRAG